jgi:hemolysin activation/secretion protein
MRWWFCLIPILVHSAPPPVPGAGVIEREIEREYEGQPLEEEKEIPSVEVDIPEERMTLPSDEKVYVKLVKVEGNCALSTPEILTCLNGLLNREMNLGDIYHLCQLVNQLYADRGYFLARTYPPPQEVQNGVLTIRVLEGRIGRIRIEGNRYYGTRFICRYFLPFCQQTVRYSDFLKALLLLNENPDLSAGALFEKGKEVGTADLVIRVHDSRPVHLYLNENNYGKLLTTNVQFGGRLDWGNCIVDGAKFSVAEVLGLPIKGLDFTDATYTFPINAKGLSMQLAFLYSQFDIEELRPLRPKGKSMIGTVKATQAVMRTKKIGLDVFGYFDIKQIQNLVLGQRISDDRLRILTVGTLFDHYNSARGRDYLNFRMGIGIPGFLGSMPPVDNDSSRLGGGGRFIKFNLDYDRVQQLYKEWMLYLHASGQWSPNKLTMPEQIYIGGSNTVRGFPLSVGLGDYGYYANIETRFPLPFFMDRRFFLTKKTWKEVLQLVAFFDSGATKFNEGSGIFLAGTGFGLRFTGPYTLSLSFDVGFPINHIDLSSGSFGYLKLTAQPF